MRSKTTPLCGLVLGGGLSVRMGADKAYLNYHGKPQRDYAFELLDQFCGRTYFSINAQATSDKNTITDAYPFKGPLNGILSAFKHQPDAAWLTLPVDMPFVDETIIQFLIDHRDVTKVATCFYDSEGKLPEPLLTIWEPSCALLLKAFYDEGKTSPRDFLKTANIKLLQVPNKKALKNINTPSDFDEFLDANRKMS
ncbi:MAG: NTP transferase domain-containing protein [Cyclobacteriaceae bacterium]